MFPARAVVQIAIFMETLDMQFHERIDCLSWDDFLQCIASFLVLLHSWGMKTTLEDKY